MIDTQRTKREKEFHEAYFAATEIRNNQSRFYSNLVQSALLDRALTRIHPIPSGNLLHLGCGLNLEIPNRLLEKGADRVCSVDLSEIACRAVRHGLRGQGESWRYVAVMNAEQLGFASESFDVVFGRAIVHHLDVERIVEELFRVLKPGGQAVLIEPVGINPLINCYRHWTPHARTLDEHPLDSSDLQKFERRFEVIDAEYLFLTQLVPIVLLSRIQGGTFYRACFYAFGALDRCLYLVLPFLRKYSWCVIFSVTKRLGVAGPPQNGADAG